MRFRVTHIAAVLFAGGALAACGGGSTSSPAPSTPYATSAPPAGQTRQTVSPSGGALSVAVSGGTLTARFPNGAFIAPTSVTLTSYAASNQVPVINPFAKRRDVLPAGAVFLGGFAIDTGSSAMYAPTTVTVPITAAVPSGDVVRVAHYGRSGFSDVDTATVTGGSATNDINAKYVSVSNGGTSSPYVVYAISAAAAAAPASITISVTTAPSAPPMVIGTTQSFTATGVDANGNVLPFSASFTTSGVGAAIGARSNPLTAAITASTQGGTLTVSAKDSRTGVSGSANFTVYTQRPANSGDAFSFSGTLSRGDTYTYPASNPLPSTNVTSQVTQNVNVTATANPFGSGNAQDFNVAERDASPSQTLSAKTDFYYQLGAPVSGVSAFSLLGFKSTDDANDVTTVQYTTPTIVDQLPESTSASWTNSPAQTFNQTTPSGDSVARTIHADGSYTETDHLYGSGTSYPSILVNLQENSDLSAAVAITRYEDNSPFGYPPGTLAYDNYFISAPGFSGFGIPQLTFSSQSYLTTGTPAPIAQYAPPSPIWYATKMGSTIGPIYTETNTNKGSSALPASCNVPSSLGTKANQLVQNISSTDAVLGTLTTTTTTQWVVTGFGPVCEQMASDIKTFYNYNDDTTTYGPVFQGAVPQQETKLAETLTLQASGTNVTAQTATRRSSGASLVPIAPGAIAQARVQLAQLVARDRLHRLRAFASKLMHRQSKGVHV